MSGAAIRLESIRLVLPSLREAAADRAETVGCRGGVPGVPPHHAGTGWRSTAPVPVARLFEENPL
jgi:hypothetical protein